MSDAVDRLAQALRDAIHEAVQEAVERDRRTLPPERVVQRPKVPDQDFDLCPWCTATLTATQRLAVATTEGQRDWLALQWAEWRSRAYADSRPQRYSGGRL